MPNNITTHGEVTAIQIKILINKKQHSGKQGKRRHSLSEFYKFNLHIDLVQHSNLHSETMAVICEISSVKARTISAGWPAEQPNITSTCCEHSTGGESDASACGDLLGSTGFQFLYTIMNCFKNTRNNFCLSTWNGGKKKGENPWSSRRIMDL